MLKPTNTLLALVVISTLGATACSLEQGPAAEMIPSISGVPLQPAGQISRRNGLHADALVSTYSVVLGTDIHQTALSTAGIAGNEAVMQRLLVDWEDQADVMRTLVECALPPDASVTVDVTDWDPDLFPAPVIFQGDMGLASSWGSGSCDTDCQEVVSACLLARVNYAHQHVCLGLAGLPVGSGSVDSYPLREGAYFGNLFPSHDWSVSVCYDGDHPSLVDRVCNGSGHCSDLYGEPIFYHPCSTIANISVDADGAYQFPQSFAVQGARHAITVFRVANSAGGLPVADGECP